MEHPTKVLRRRHLTSTGTGSTPSTPKAETMPRALDPTPRTSRNPGEVHDPDVLAYLACQRAAGRRDATIAQARIVLRQWHEHLGATSTTDSVVDASRADAYAYLEHLQGTGAKPGGIASRLRVLRAFYSWCMREEMTDHNPFAGITVKVPEEVRPTPDETAIDAMLASAKGNRRDTAVLLVLIDTGARKSECANVEFGDIDLHSGTITFRVSKTRARTVPMSDRLIVAMTRWCRQRGTAKGNLWGPRATEALVRAVVERHSRRMYTAHSLRRSFAVRWLAKGGSESGLMRICGWSTSEMVRVYIRSQADRLAHDEYRRLVA
jgi:integrase